MLCSNVMTSPSCWSERSCARVSPATVASAASRPQARAHQWAPRAVVRRCAVWQRQQQAAAAAVRRRAYRFGRAPRAASSASGRRFPASHRPSSGASAGQCSSAHAIASRQRHASAGLPPRGSARPGHSRPRMRCGGRRPCRGPWGRWGQSGQNHSNNDIVAQKGFACLHAARVCVCARRVGVVVARLAHPLVVERSR